MKIAGPPGQQEAASRRLPAGARERTAAVAPRRHPPRVRAADSGFPEQVRRIVRGRAPVRGCRPPPPLDESSPRGRSGPEVEPDLATFELQARLERPARLRLEPLEQRAPAGADQGLRRPDADGLAGDLLPDHEPA